MLKSSSTATKTILLTLILWGGLTVWFAYNRINDVSENARFAFGAVYGAMAILGGVCGLIAARNWGGWKSKLGRTILFLSAGLMAAEFGQLVFSYYNIIRHVDIPYPSIADIGFFGNIPLYILALVCLWQVTGTKYSLAKHKAKLLILLLPVAGLVMSYMVFLKGYDFTDASPVRVALDFGYPFGQAIYITLAILIFILAVRTLGGVMKKRILLLILAFAAQYTADFNFLYQTLHSTWMNGGYGDYLYLMAYTFMALSLISFMSLDIGFVKKEKVLT